MFNEQDMPSRTAFEAGNTPHPPVFVCRIGFVVACRRADESVIFRGFFLDVLGIPEVHGASGRIDSTMLILAAIGR